MELDDGGNIIRGKMVSGLCLCVGIRGGWSEVLQNHALRVTVLSNPVINRNGADEVQTKLKNEDRTGLIDNKMVMALLTNKNINWEVQGFVLH